MVVKANNLRLSIICILCAAIAFSSNDVLIKVLSGDYALHQLVAVRALIALIITVAIFAPKEGVRIIYKANHPYILIIRGFLYLTANLMFFLGIVVVPIAEATAVFFVAPLFVTVFSIIFLREKVGARRWLAVALGSLGVLLVVQPGGSNFQVALLFPLGAAVALAFANVLTRKLGITESAATMTIYVHVIFIIVCLLIGLAIGDGRFSGSANPSTEFLFRSWRIFSFEDFLKISASGVLIAAAVYLVAQAYRLSEASLIAPFEYVSLINVLFWGFIIWGEIPNLYAWVGIILIVCAGVFIAVRESKIGSRKRI